MGTLFDFMSTLNLDADFREQFADPKNQDQMLDDYDLTAEQKDLIKFVVDENNDYDERARSVGIVLESEYGKIPERHGLRGTKGVVFC